MARKKKELPSHIRKIIDQGLADCKAGRIVPAEQDTRKVLVSFPICMDFFNDTKKPINIRTTPWTHEKNPEVILPLEAKKIYIQQGFLKLWDNGDHFQLLVE